jgi:hypothetical protein
MSKLQSLNENVNELQGIMKDNVGTIVRNMTDLETVEKKSSIMSELSMSLESDSKYLIFKIQGFIKENEKKTILHQDGLLRSYINHRRNHRLYRIWVTNIKTIYFHCCYYKKC